MTTSDAIDDLIFDDDMSAYDAIRRAQKALERSTEFTADKYAINRTDPEAFLWLMVSVANSLLAIAKRT